MLLTVFNDIILLMTYFPIELHTHSTASDGKLSPTSLVILAASQQMQAIALTDHDTAAGLDEALTTGKTHQVTVIPGIEFSTRHEYDKGFVRIHLLGYFTNHHHPHLITVVKQVQKALLEQKIKQIEKLTHNL
jgi:predicted metal-dependent phosphoesterase TrpH